MAVTSRKNQYRGINAHLNSSIQQTGNRWEAFHTHHIGDIEIQLSRQLHGTGYVARLGSGVQIRYRNEPGYPESDVLVWDTDPSRFSSGSAILADSGRYRVLSATAVVTHPELYEDAEYFKAVRIYRLDAEEIPVAWIELLSPSNKKGGSHYREYLERRDRLLETQSCTFVEIDYLHRSSPTIRELPDYTRNAPAATPYRVAVIDTRHSIRQGKAYILEFGVDTPIPPIPIPLHGKDIVEFDLQTTYQTTYHRADYGIKDDTQVDYTKLPPDFESYSPADRKKIVLRMLAVLDAVQNGMDLEAGNEPLPLDETRLISQAKNLLPGVDFALFK